MRRLCIALATVGIAVCSVACTGGSGTATPTSGPSATGEGSAVPSATPTAPASISASAAPATASISLTEWKVVVTGAIKSGATDLTIKDVGVAAHEFLVFKSDLDPSAYPTDKNGDIVEDGPGVELVSDGENIDPGGTQTRTIDLTPGTYLFVCNIPSHFKNGMYTVVTVAP